MGFILFETAAMIVISGASHLLCRRFWSGVGWSVVLLGWLYTFLDHGAIPIAALAVTLVASAGLAFACACMMPRWRRNVFWLPAIGLAFVYVELGGPLYRAFLEMTLIMYTPIGTAVGTGLAARRGDRRSVIWGTVLTVLLAILALPQFDAQFHLIFQNR